MVLASRLKSPVQRLWFIVGSLGALVAVVAVFLFEVFVPYYSFIEALTNRPYAHWSYKAWFIVGCALSGIGYAFAFWYDATIGRLLRWVKNGS